MSYVVRYLQFIFLRQELSMQYQKTTLLAVFRCQKRIENNKKYFKGILNIFIYLGKNLFNTFDELHCHISFVKTFPFPFELQMKQF